MMGLVLSVTLVHVGLAEGKRTRERTTFRRRRVETPRVATDRGQFENLHSFRARYDLL